MTENITFVIAILAGLFSFLSPCVFPLVPAYIGYLSGAAVTAEGVKVHRRDTVLHALAFVMGFSLIFILLGVTAWSIGDLLYSYVPWLSRIGGAVLIVFGLALIGVFKLPFIDSQRGIEIPVYPRLGYLSSVLIGIFFGAGWNPFIGPVLGGILILASNAATATQGALLLAAYSLGMALPFLLVGAALDTARDVIRHLNRRGNLISTASGVVLVLLGIGVLTNRLHLLSQYGPLISIDSWLLR